MTGELVRVPNHKVFERAVINYSVTTRRRVDLPCGVAYDSGLEQVRAVALAAMQGFLNLLPDRPVEVMFTGFGDSAINFTLRFWIPYTKRAWLKWAEALE